MVTVASTRRRTRREAELARTPSVSATAMVRAVKSSIVRRECGTEASWTSQSCAATGVKRMSSRSGHHAVDPVDPVGLTGPAAEDCAASNQEGSASSSVTGKARWRQRSPVRTIAPSPSRGSAQVARTSPSRHSTRTSRVLSA
ncbi:predicted protein [Streptomyces sp. C]|nr:predicted protein [Streptomyces sp. C]